jgi:hypothetical protein
MKKCLTLLFSIVIIANTAKAQSNWVTHRADNRISVKFPTEPKELIKGSYGMALKDSSNAFVLTVVDFEEVAHIDSTALAPYKSTPEFAAQLKAGMNKSLPNVTLEDFKIGTWKGFTNYTSSGTDNLKNKYNLFMLLIGNKLYSLSTIIKSNATTNLTSDYFSSILLSN